MTWIQGIIASAVFLLSSLFGNFLPNSNTNTPIVVQATSTISAVTKTPPNTQTAQTETNNIDLTSATLITSSENLKLYSVISGSRTEVEQFLVVDERTGKRILLDGAEVPSQFEADTAMLGQLKESDDAAYIALDYGTSFSRGVGIYSLTTGKNIANFCAVGGSPFLFFWKNYVVYRGCDGPQLNTPWEAGVPNIDATNLENNATTTLVSSASSGSFYLYNIVGISNNQLTYGSTKLSQDANSTWWDMGSSTATQEILDLTSVLMP